MNEQAAEGFKQHILRKYSLSSSKARRGSPDLLKSIQGRRLRELWEATDLSAAEFADEVARHWGIKRLTLPQLLASVSLLEQFSRRFLRESTVLPYQDANGRYGLAVADPSDAAAIRAAEIVFGEPVEIAIGSFEDIVTVLEENTEADDVTSDAGKEPAPQSDDDIDSLRDLASGAPVVRAFNDLLERAVELRASDIHIEPFRTGLVVRMRVDGLLRAIPPPAGIPPQALVSRIKILAGLNIAERRLPQDGAARSFAPAAASSISASPPCRRRRERVQSCGCCRAIAASSIWESSVFRKRTKRPLLGFLHCRTA